MIVIVSRKMQFDAAHYLPNHPGKCANLHGHRWTVEIGIAGEVNQTTGFVLDFTALKASMKGLLDPMDHQLLNQVLPNPTAENLIQLIVSEFNIPVDLELKFIRIWETPDSCAEWRVEDNREVLELVP